MNITYKIKSAFLKWFSDIQLFRVPLWFIFGKTSYNINGVDSRNILNVLQPGDVLLRRYDHYVAGLFIPGYFTHVSIYVGDDNVIHMLGDGICKEDILTFLRCDDILVLRHSDPRKSETAIKKAFEFLLEKIPYDYDFNFQLQNRFSCTELVDNCYDHFEFNSKKMDKIISPDDFLNVNQLVTIWKK